MTTEEDFQQLFVGKTIEAVKSIPVNDPGVSQAWQFFCGDGTSVLLEVRAVPALTAGRPAYSWVEVRPTQPSAEIPGGRVMFADFERMVVIETPRGAASVFYHDEVPVFLWDADGFPLGCKPPDVVPSRPPDWVLVYRDGEARRSSGVMG